jgi:hypothetical protein
MGFSMDKVTLDGPVAIGKPQLIKHLNGKRLTFKGAILAKCYECMGYFRDGKVDCRITKCPLYPFQAYREISSDP